MSRHVLMPNMAYACGGTVGEKPGGMMFLTPTNFAEVGCPDCRAIGHQTLLDAQARQQGREPSTARDRRPTFEILATQLENHARINYTPEERGMADLRTLTALVTEAELMRTETIEALRTAETPVPWAEIGKTLGTSKQAAQKRYGRKPTGPDPDRETTLPGL